MCERKDFHVAYEFLEFVKSKIIWRYGPSYELVNPANCVMEDLD